MIYINYILLFITFIISLIGVVGYKKIALIKEAEKIYKQLNKYEKYQNLTDKDLDHVLHHTYKFKEYFASGNFEGKRPTAKILKMYLEDVENGLVSIEAAKSEYGVVLEKTEIYGEYLVDEEKTNALRKKSK